MFLIYQCVYHLTISKHSLGIRTLLFVLVCCILTFCSFFFHLALLLLVTFSSWAATCKVYLPFTTNRPSQLILSGQTVWGSTVYTHSPHAFILQDDIVYHSKHNTCIISYHTSACGIRKNIARPCWIWDADALFFFLDTTSACYNKFQNTLTFTIRTVH